MTKRKHNGAQWRHLQARIKATQDTCHLCGQPINKTLHHLDDWAYEIDHIIPLAQGGPEYDINNLAAAHRKCNRQKSDGHNNPTAGPPSQDWSN